MKKVAISIIPACTNVALLGLGYLDETSHWLSHVPSAISILPLVITFVVIPLLFLTTIVLAIRDLFRAVVRWQAVCALILSVPVGIVYWHPQSLLGL